MALPRCLPAGYLSGLLFLILWLAGTGTSTSAPADATAVEALRRLKGMDLEANPTLKSAVLRVLEGLRGAPEFVEVVRDFQLTGQEDGLLEVARRHPDATGGAEAMRLLLGQGAEARIRLAWTAPGGGDAVIRALSNSGDSKALPLLVEVATNHSVSASARASAVQGLARSESGARELLRLAEGGGLDDAARGTASLALAQARWPAIREEALKRLPLPKAGDGTSLPPLSELVTLTGDAARGAVVFRSESVACIRCHRVGDEGVDFGPALGQIGSKLGRQALYESILDPSAGISFGYEGWTVETKDGEEVFGIMASETAEELAIKQQTGVLTRVPVAKVARREKQGLSVMPAGLAQTMTREQLVDLVEYLLSLKAPASP
ncbi:MAG: c-type cytochrome [Verrucomicrobiales bacterium]|nr:c-type cytochrome [Verrucomicrobiales bacterium]